MIKTERLYDSVIKASILDAMMLVLVYYLPSISHLTAIPFYLFDPMRIMVISSYFILKNKNNSLLVAITLPLFSFIISGHPLFIKSIIISVELFANIILLDYFFKSKQKVFLSVMGSILLSKLLYYLIKSGVVLGGLLHTVVFDTNIFIQLTVTLFFSLLLASIVKR